MLGLSHFVGKNSFGKVGLEEAFLFGGATKALNYNGF